MQSPLPQRTLDFLSFGALEGSRNQEMHFAAQQFRDAGYPIEEAIAQLSIASAFCGIGSSECTSACRSAYRQARREAISGKREFSGSRKQNNPGSSEPEWKPNPITGVEPMEVPNTDLGFKEFLLACFKEGERIAIDIGKLSEDGMRVVPGAGVTFTREEWIEKHEKKKGIQNCFKGSLGVYARINPIVDGGTSDRDVTAFRHVLVEFDKVDKRLQYAAELASGLPISAIIDSAGDSIHAWVRVDARDRDEYNRRVEIVFGLFSEYGLDPQNRNPSRYSRCPDGMRGDVKQRLLDINVGAESWDAWEADQDGEGSETITVSQMLAFDRDNDPDSMFGKRWLCKGGSMVIQGSSGIGKSSLMMQAIVAWSLGKPFFGIAPSRAFKFLIIQAENDVGDLSEAFQDITTAMVSAGYITEGEIETVENQAIFKRQTVSTGYKFVEYARRQIKRHKPDIVFADPLLAYVGDDISEIKVVSQFLRNWLSPVLLETGVLWIWSHHSGKPKFEQRSGKTNEEKKYTGIGSSDIVNWAREVVTLSETKTEGTYELDFGKRWKRTGIKDEFGNKTRSIYIKHSNNGIVWLRAEEPRDPHDISESREDKEHAKKVKEIQQHEARLLSVQKFIEDNGTVLLERLKECASQAGSSYNRIKSLADELHTLGRVGKVQEDKKTTYTKL